MRQLIRTDDSIVNYDQPLTARQVGTLIGAACCDTVTLRHMEPPHVMWVDDNGWETSTSITHYADGSSQMELQPVRARKPINKAGTWLYRAECRPGTTHEIAGDVFVCPVDDFEEPFT